MGEYSLVYKPRRSGGLYNCEYSPIFTRLKVILDLYLSIFTLSSLKPNKRVLLVIHVHVRRTNVSRCCFTEPSARLACSCLNRRAACSESCSIDRVHMVHVLVHVAWEVATLENTIVPITMENTLVQLCGGSQSLERFRFTRRFDQSERGFVSREDLTNQREVSFHAKI